MTSLPNLALMSVVEYCDFLESTALYTGVDMFELNMEYCFEMGSISNERYERAKWELFKRQAPVEYTANVKELLLETTVYLKSRNRK